jgi:hypothetical protein
MDRLGFGAGAGLWHGQAAEGQPRLLAAPGRPTRDAGAARVLRALADEIECLAVAQTRDLLDSARRALEAKIAAAPRWLIKNRGPERPFVVKMMGADAEVEAARQAARERGDQLAVMRRSVN